MRYVQDVYLAYELSRSLAAPLHLWSATVRDAFGKGPVSSLPWSGTVVASAELVERATRRYEKPSFGLTETRIDGALVAVREVVVDEVPFCKLVRFDRAVARPSDPHVIVVAPLSGHHATLVRETVEQLLPDHVVYVTDWVDAKLVAAKHGPFDLHDYIDLMARFIRRVGPGTHVLAVCQPCVPVLAAVAMLAEGDDPAQPASLTLISGPIDPRIQPTKVNRFALQHSTAKLETTLVYRVPATEPGRGRRVYPGALQLSAFMSMDVSRHVEAHLRQFWNVTRSGSVPEAKAAAEKHRRFYDEYFAVLDLPAEFYLQTVSEVFQEFTLPRGVMRHRGGLVRPASIERTALLTIEGEKDDITGLGQTEAAHGLCSRIPAAMRRHHVQAGVGHYGTFSGRRWRDEIAPIVRSFVREHAGAATS